MARVIGTDVELYVGGDRTTGTRVTTIRGNVNFPASAPRVDITNQGDTASGYKASRLGLKDGVVSFEVTDDPSDAGNIALEAQLAAVAGEFSLYRTGVVAPLIHWNADYSAGWQANVVDRSDAYWSVEVARTSDAGGGS